MNSFIYNFSFAKRLVASQCIDIGKLFDSDQVQAALIRATRLWNYIDCCEDPEYLWAIMASGCDYLFDNPRNFNSIQFTYRSVRIRFRGDQRVFELCGCNVLAAAWRIAKQHKLDVEDSLYWNSTEKAWLRVITVRISLRLKPVKT